MRLSDIMSHANLAIYAEVGLVIFMLVFFVVALRVLTQKKGAYNEESQLPFDDGAAQVKRPFSEQSLASGKPQPGTHSSVASVQGGQL